MGLIDSMHNVASRHLRPDEPMEFCDFGVVQGGSAMKREMKIAFWCHLTKSSTSQHMALDYSIVVVTEKDLKFIPVKMAMLGNRWKNKDAKAVEVYPRDQVRITVGEIATEDGGARRQNRIGVEFTLPDGAAKKLEMHR